MQVVIPIKGRWDAPQPAAPLNVFWEHPLVWWAGLNQMERIAIFAVALGVSALVGAAALWLWQQWRWLTNTASHARI